MTTRSWKSQAIKRSGNKCELTGLEGNVFRLEVHHFYDKSSYPSKATAINNAIVLIRALHRAFHKWMGGFRVSTTKRDFKRWLRTKDAKELISKYKGLKTLISKKGKIVSKRKRKRKDTDTGKTIIMWLTIIASSFVFGLLMYKFIQVTTNRASEYEVIDGSFKTLYFKNGRQIN
jgi:hypothetical protein